jgi:hypothetical protein
MEGDVRRKVRDCEDGMSSGIDSLESLDLLPHLTLKYEYEIPRVTNRKKAPKNYNFSICSTHKMPTRTNSGTVGDDDDDMIMYCFNNSGLLLFSTEHVCTLDIQFTVKADVQQIRIAKAVVKYLQCAYAQYSFDNPKLDSLAEHRASGPWL